jgi:endonuclease/exonuclease/phosphatase (EEP) superfamily protein YafD
MTPRAKTGPRTARRILTPIVFLLILLNALAFVGGAFSPALDMIADATPALLLGGVLAWLIARALDAPVVATVALLGAAAPPGIVIAAEAFFAVRAPVAEVPAALKVMSINLWSENNDLVAIERLIADERPDVLLLQEAYGAKFDELLERLDDTFPTNVSRYQHCSARVLSILPLIEIVEQRLAGADCATAAVRLALPERLGGGELLVASVHLPGARHGEDSRSLYATLRSSLANRSARSAIIGGDFNITPWSWELRRFDLIKGISRRTRAMFTWPAPKQESSLFAIPAFLPIDHIYASEDWRTLNARRGRPISSDHYPVIVELTRNEGGSSRSNGR